MRRAPGLLCQPRETLSAVGAYDPTVNINESANWSTILWSERPSLTTACRRCVGQVTDRNGERKPVAKIFAVTYAGSLRTLRLIRLTSGWLILC
jgi:hypothetical protein